MKPVKNTTLPWEFIFPVGTKLRWIQKDTRASTVITVKDYASCGTLDCKDCDKKAYLDENGAQRCHFRSPNSSYGLSYWEKA